MENRNHINNISTRIMASVVFIRYMHSQDIDTISLQVDLHFNQ